MIELLTPSATGGLASPGTKSAGGALGGIDFAVLFGSVAQVATDGVVPTVADGATPTPAVTLAAPAVPNVLGIALPTTAAPDEASPVVGPTVATPVAVAPVVVPTAGAVPAVVPPAVVPLAVVPPAAVTPAVPAAPDPTAQLGALATATPSQAETDAAIPAVSTATPPAKPVTIKPHRPVVLDDTTVKPPTLPADFVAREAPRVPAAADAAGDDKDEAAPENPAATPPVPPCAAPVIAAPAPVTAVVATTVPATLAGSRAGVSAKAGDKAPAIKIEAAAGAPADPARSDVATVALPDMSASPVVATHAAAANDYDAVVPTPMPLLAPALGVDASTATPVADTSAAPTSSQQSAALDDLMVAGAGDSAWLDRLSGDITTLARGGGREAHMKINPPWLGDMSIRLEMDGQRTRVHFTVDTEQAATLISDGTQKLTSLVQANGLKLDGATVDLSQRRDDGRPPHPGQQQQRQANGTTNFTRTQGETARMVERTRLAIATERFA